MKKPNELLPHEIKLPTPKSLGLLVLGRKFNDLEGLIVEPDFKPDYSFKSKGYLVYDPVQNKDFQPWWLMLKTDDEIVSYYQYYIQKKFGVKLLNPSFNSHISIIAGEEPVKNKEKWKINHGKEIEFEYTQDIFTKGDFWWLRTNAPEFNQIRSFFGLPEINNHFHQNAPYHLTIGKPHPHHLKF